MKKIISLILSVLLIFSVCVPALAAQEEEYPTVYVIGARVLHIQAADGTSLFPNEGVDTEAVIKEAIKPCLEKLALGMLTDNYEAWAQEFYEAVIKVMGKLPLDKNGEASDGSHPVHPYNHSLPQKTSNYGDQDYRLSYDWRISPIETAELLKKYIDEVKAVTKEDKVNIIGRCYGANVVQAYLTLYPEHAVNNVDDVAYLSSSVDGIDALGALFTGDIELDDQAITNFVDYYMENGDLIEDETVRAFINVTVELLNEVTVLGLTGNALELFVDRVKNDIFPLVLKDTFAGWPSYWAMLPADKYEQAISFIFNGVEDEYAKFIEKCDNYHYNVQLKATETLKSLDAQGIDFYMISKYNFPDFPIFEGATALSDGNTTVVRQSFGATCADHGTVLSEKYINSLEDKTYLSPDLKIDASTCLFPETSYFIKNMHHETFPAAINQFALKVMNGEATVSDGTYSQYLLYNGSSVLEPVEGLDEDSETPKKNVLMIFISFITKLMNILTKLFNGELSLNLSE